MDLYKKYVVKTSAFGVVAIIATVLVIVFLYQKSYFLAIICLLMLLVSLDNFFCGRNAKACGVQTDKHYIIPPFLKR